MKYILFVGFFAVTTLIFWGCGENYFYAKSETIEEQSWPKDKVKGFGFSVEDTTSSFNFIVNVRNTTDYQYRNLYVFMNTIYPDNTSSRDTMELILAAPSGRWLGKGSGFYRDNLFMFKKNVHLPLKGEYRMEFIQAMRTDTLKGIDEIGLRIQKNDSQ
ncbi:MAG: gliding motility lipoprotein GldH [Bacteroidales bacterium]|nr:gliding motility lipoprotein GldH [Bacteroidales bacterium]MCF8328041.1 gliding motility lipoprotein GldH [Bacteroidales bacterium]